MSKTARRPLANKKRKNSTRKVRGFTNNDYCSPDGMLTQVWGPSMWHFLHTMSFNYPVNPTSQDKANYKQFLNSMKYVLPCRHCRENLTANYKKLPLSKETMKNRDSLSRYIFNLHEKINCQLGKKSGLSYAAVRDRYENFRSRCNRKKKKTKKEAGCVDSFHGKKSRCLIRIVPESRKCPTLLVDKRCTLSPMSQTD